MSTFQEFVLAFLSPMVACSDCKKVMMTTCDSYVLDPVGTTDGMLRVHEALVAFELSKAP